MAEPFGPKRFIVVNVTPWKLLWPFSFLSFGNLFKKIEKFNKFYIVCMMYNKDSLKITLKSY